MDITKEEINKAIYYGYSVIVIINGEYYNYLPDKEKLENIKKSEDLSNDL